MFTDKPQSNIPRPNLFN